MTKSLRIGDRVKLTDRYADVLMRRWRVPTSSRYINWKKRVGSITRLNDSDVFIKWDGRNSLDAIPIKAVEPVPASVSVND